MVARKPRKTPGTGTATAQAANAYQQDRPLPTGLATTRRATIDPAKGTVDLRVTYAAQAATLGGPFLEVLPGARSGASCPAVTWSGEGITAKRNQPSLTGVDTACAWSLSGVEVPAGGDVTVEASVPLAVEDGAALQTWLDGVGEATTTAVTDDAVRGTAYPVQRLQGVEVRTPDRTVSQTALPVTLVPVWPNGADELNPLYRSPSSGRPSQMLVDVAGGESGVRFADGCSGALAVSSDENRGHRAVRRPVCTVRATVGNFTNLERLALRDHDAGLSGSVGAERVGRATS